MFASLFVLIGFVIAFWVSKGTHKKLQFGLLLALPLLAGGIYLAVGSLDMAGQPQAARLDSQNLPPIALAAKIENHLAENPSDPKAWQTLAILYLALGDPRQAAEAFARADAIAPNQNLNRIGRAQAEISLNQGIINQKTRRLLNAIIQSEPDHLVALFFLATDAAQAGNPKTARKILTRARAIAQKQKQTEWINIIQKQIDQL